MHQEANQIARKVADNFFQRKIEGSDKYGNNYEVELSYEALIYLGLCNEKIESYLKSEGMLDPSFAKDWIYQEFHDAAYPWFESKGQLSEFKAAYLQSTDKWIQEAVRRESGTIVYHGPQALLGSLIDMLQAYMLRLCRAAVLSNDRQYAEEAVNQYRLYKKELRNPISGCFHQGKGWLENDAISPSPWSRGQGWIVHGLVHCLPLLQSWPDLQEELRANFEELLSDLLKWQTASGFWNQLIDRPAESLPDTSGTALITESLILGVKNGYLIGDKYQKSAEQAWEVLKQQVDEDGFVDQACKGPGTIWKIEPWLNTRAPNGEPHGIFSMLFVCNAILK
jgi:rhamnogalacturonyl hydrolase YesR